MDIEHVKSKVRDAAEKTRQQNQNVSEIEMRVENCELALVELAELLAGGDDNG